MWKRKKVVRYPAVSSLSLVSVRDAAGFDVGVVWQPGFAQGTIQCSVEGFSRARVQRWVERVCAVDGVLVVGVSRSNCDASVQGWVTVDTGKAKQDDFLVALAIKAPSLYAPQDDLVWVPADKNAVIERVNRVVAPSGELVFPPQVQVVDESVESVMLAEESLVVFEVMAQDDVGVVEEIVGVCEAVREFVVVRWVELFRPADPAYVEQHADVVPYRRSMVLVISGDTATECEQAVSVVLGMVSARARLRITRLWGRQHMGVFLSAGLPVYGWQQSQLISEGR
ncbi:hypothetical protein CMUST_15535 (plasmid) [Corynebacterium mustelae]|uniref:Uncharacterized protein n=1 Tax=Corynebacterium mustelae TaxID=571915 RepID=A0A0G3H1V8_9CORY|nr:hypothetical protein [Corynebacterium mustelae]AKK07396.1 hypothetical protein CMUST_15535 [Corynebacterium mustelae]